MTEPTVCVLCGFGHKVKFVGHKMNFVDHKMKLG
jgi:hypothetical protein